jgi:Kef-type K+ transport system membrane component KefB
MEFSIPLEHPVLQFTALVVAALLLQLLFERMHLPGLIGLVLVGMLIGPDGLGFVPREPVAALLGEIGLIYIMFLAGAEIDLKIVREQKTVTAGFGLLTFGLPFVLALAGGWLMDLSWRGMFLLGAAVSSHTLVAYPLLKRLGVVHRKPLVTAIGGTLLTDTLALVLLALLVQHGDDNGSGSGGLGGWLMPLLLLAVLIAVSLVVVPRLLRFLFAREEVSREEKALFAIGVMLALAAAAAVIGTEAILGAFAAGLCLNRALRRRENLHEHLNFVGRMIFIPFFFLDTGMRLDLSVMTEPRVWLLAAMLTAIVIVGKAAAAWLAGWWLGYSQWDRAAMFALTVPQAAATLAITVTASESGHLEATTVDAVILLILITCVIGPLVAQTTGKRLQKDADSREKQPEPHEEPKLDQPPN